MTESKVAQWARIQHWTTQVIKANNCGKTKTEWCRENGISKDQFYYRQRKIRTLALNHQLGDDIMSNAVIDTTAADEDTFLDGSDGNDLIAESHSVTESKSELDLPAVKTITSTVISETEKTDFYEIPLPSDTQITEAPQESPTDNADQRNTSDEILSSREEAESNQVSSELEIVHGDTVLRIHRHTSPETLKMVMAVIRNA